MNKPVNGKNSARSELWEMVIITSLILGTVSLLFYWLFSDITWTEIIEIAFIFYLLVYAGWKHSLSSIVVVIMVCIISYWFMSATENPDYQAGVVAFENKDYQTAAEKLKQVIVDDPSHYDAYYMLCKANRKLGQFKQALSACHRAISLDYPLKNESYAARARVYEKLNLPNEAIMDYSISLQSFASWYVLWERCRMYNRVKRYDDAISDCKAALKLNNEWYDPWWPLGNAYYQKKDFNNALHAYQQYQKKALNTPEFMQKRISEIRGY